MNQRKILILENGKGHLSFFTSPIVKKSKADTIKNEWFKQFERLNKITVL